MSAAGAGHGKVILLGEHVVVYGHPALAAGLAQGAHAQVEAARATSFQVEPWGVDISLDTEQDDPDRELLRRALRALLAGWPQATRAQPLRIRAEVAIPAGAGLGGSAALGVAVARAVDRFFDTQHADQAIADAVFPWEKVFHGNPSGVDNTLAAFGGVALFQKGQPLQMGRMRRSLKLVVGHSGEAASTKTTVANVARQRERDPEKVEQIFEAVASLVRNAALAVEDGRLEHLGELMDLNQQLLGSLMLSTPRLEELCAAARNAGAYGAKLTGGGGGGCMIALVDEERGDPVLRALEDQGSQAFLTEVGP